MFWKFAITFLNGVIPTVKCEWLTGSFAIEKWSKRNSESTGWNVEAELHDLGKLSDESSLGKHMKAVENLETNLLATT